MCSTEAQTHKRALHSNLKNQLQANSPSNSNQVSSHKIRRACKWLIIPITFIFLQLSTTPTKSRNLRTLQWSNLSGISSTILRWTGKPTVSLPNKFTIKATVVINYCGEDKSIFSDYLNDKSEHVTIKDVTFISGCAEPLPQNDSYGHVIQSQLKEPELQFIEWMTSYFEHKAAGSLPDYYGKENHVIIFLSSKVIGTSETNGLDQVVQSAMENGFGCTLRPTDRMGMSYYHDPKVLSSFQSVEIALAERVYSNLGEWINKLNLSWILDSLVPVCYGSSFAIKSKDLAQGAEQFSGVLEAMENDYKTHPSRELVEFMERSFAGLFSHRLSEKKVLNLKKYSTNVYKGPGRTGALLHSWKAHEWFKLFTGDTLEKQDVDLSQVRLTLVVTYCNEDMSWMKNYFQDYNLKSIQIISKCIDEVKGNNFLDAVVTRHPNVGRCDHAWATWMESMTEEDATENHVVLFIKASRDLYQHGFRYRSVQDLIRIAMHHGFSCESEPVDKSYYYRTELLRTFYTTHHKNEYVKSSYANLGEYADAFGIELPTLLTPVCYGGNFAAKASQIYAKRDLWNKIARSLERGDSIEGHFMERFWAAILSYPLNSDEETVMENIPYYDGLSDGNWRSFAGQIHFRRIR